jgi:Circularly permutated YpsA SLOG family
MREHLTGGSLRTAELAEKHKKRMLHLSAIHQDQAAERLMAFIQHHYIRVLNVGNQTVTN